MKNKKSYISSFLYLISIAIIVVGCIYAYNRYQENNFNDFIRSESNLYQSEFKRDNEVKYENKRSYKIESNVFNDAMFYKTIDVKPNEPYRVTCKVKTENVIANGEKSGIGAQISIEGTTERSVAIQGTNNWQEIELIFNSKNRDKINIGFRLGGYLGEAKGKAWFTDFKLEEGIGNKDKTWKFACFIIKNTDVTINNKNIKLEVTKNDRQDIIETIKRFEKSANEISNKKMNAKCDIYEINTPLNTLSYDEEFGYYVAPEDVENHIKSTIEEKEDYDHIFVIVRLGDEKHENDIEVKDWIGLRSNGLLRNRVFKYKTSK